MECPKCGSSHVSKNGYRGQKQNHKCVTCGRQFVANPQQHRGYSDEVKEECLKMYVNGMGFRAIERVKGVNHNTVINWVRQRGEQLPDAPESQLIPDLAQLDELQTFVGQKKQGLAVDGS